MPVNRRPTGVQVNNAFLFVRDANATGELSKYKRVPGLGSFTLPAETGSSNEIVTMDGNIAYAQIAGVGTVTGAIPAFGAHPTHQMMQDKKGDGTQLTMSIIRLGSAITEIGDIASSTMLVAASALRTIDVPAGNRAEVLQSIRAGMIVAVQLDDSGTDPGDANPVVPYNKATPVSADDDDWRIIDDIEDDGSKIYVTPAFSAAQTVGGGDTASLFFRNPGIAYEDKVGTITQMDAGDFQAGSSVASNFTFQPALDIGTAAVMGRIALDATKYEDRTI